MKRILKISLIALVTAAIALWFGARWVMSFSTADYSGEIALPGIAAPVEITFDEKGIPQIWAETDDDLYFALGWQHAAERLFQMELSRRYVRGELSEVFGELAYEVDKRQRRLRFKRIGRLAESELSPEAARLIQRYCEGINAWVAYKKVLPPEFVILGFTPEPWQVKDCLSLAVYQTWYAHSLMDREPEYRQLVKKLGEEVYAMVRQPQSWSPATVPANLPEDMFGAAHYALRMTEASNSWVIAPQKSASGAAMHASDPHLEVHRAPGFWYIAGLHSRKEGTNILGVTVPGVPSVVMGHNGKIAFAFTVASVDVIDYYRFERDPQDSLRILTPDGYRKMEIDEEQIPVEGESRERRETFYHTPVGPVVEMAKDHVIALRWAGWDFSPAKMMEAALSLTHTDNFQDFRRIVTKFGALDVNWTYSDARGNIGYQLGAPIPKRPDMNTYALLNGADSASYWRGYYPLDETPYVYNPPDGWAATCNNRVVGEDWPYPLPGFYDPYRITRASALLSEKNSYTVEDSYNLQMDEISGVSRRWKNLLAEGARTLQQPELAAEIDAWDGSLDVNSRTAATFKLWWEFLSKSVFEDELGEDWADGKRILEETLTGNWQQVIDDQRTADRVETSVEVSASALQYVLDTFGRPEYGAISKHKISHPLGSVKLLDTWLDLNRGPFPIGGDKGTLNANFNFWIDADQQFRCVAAPSMRFVLDWSDVDGFTISGNLGQSGNPFSPHYDDFLKMWQNGERWNVPFTRDKVFAKSIGVLRLVNDKDKG